MSDKTLEQLATELRDYLTREATNRQEWIEIQIGICLTLVEMRDRFPHNTEFGKWFRANGFGDDVMNDNKRASAIEMGRDPDRLSNCLINTKRSSLETIYDNEFKLSLGNVPNTEPNDTKRKTRMSTREKVVTFAQERSNTGFVIAEVEREYGESAGMRASELRTEGILIGTGVKRPTGNGRSKAEVLVHRDFATPAMLEAVKAKKKTVNVLGKKKRALSVPLNRYAVPLVTSTPLSYEETHGFPREKALEIDPTTGLPNDITFMHKYGHGSGIAFERRVQMEKHKEAVRLAPQLRDLTKALKAINPPLSQFLYIPPQQPNHAIEPMPPLEFVQAVLEIKDGAHIRGKVEEALANLAPEIAAFNENVAKINKYITELRAAMTATSPDITTTEIATVTKH
jgi:hypothetical protein